MRVMQNTKGGTFTLRLACEQYQQAICSAAERSVIRVYCDSQKQISLASGFVWLHDNDHNSDNYNTGVVF
jgi:hypothetical protein